MAPLSGVVQLPNDCNLAYIYYTYTGGCSLANRRTTDTALGAPAPAPPPHPRTAPSKLPFAGTWSPVCAGGSRRHPCPRGGARFVSCANLPASHDQLPRLLRTHLALPQGLVSDGYPVPHGLFIAGWPPPTRCPRPYWRRPDPPSVQQAAMGAQTGSDSARCGLRSGRGGGPEALGNRTSEGEDCVGGGGCEGGREDVRT
jgi:hypothetical protein